MHFWGFMAKDATFDKYQAEDDHRTLTRGEEIKGDRKRMAGVKKHHRAASKQLGKVGKLFGGKR